MKKIFITNLKLYLFFGRWERFRNYTVQELKTTYGRLGVNFDEYQWESMFGARDIEDVLDSLRSCGVLTMTAEGDHFYIFYHYVSCEGLRVKLLIL